MKRSRILGSLTLAIALYAALLGPTDYFIKSVSAASSASVSISNFAIVPHDLTIQVGDVVVWTNNDPVLHTLWFTRASDKSDYLVSDPINPSAAWAHTFNEVVQLKYSTMDRLWVNGTLNVSTVVGGAAIPVNKIALLAPFLGLTSVVAAMVTTAVYLKRIRSRKTME
ncbi:hypothetical protein AUI06_12400 [archaeon 13_2_20CM_2_52_21]|nr:MAG: hypothetical protein AUI06_12400 [archaeon 13_2_20CM_2_52_21]